MEPISYSVLIPSYNSADTIHACLTSVVQQQFDEAYEILVIDSSCDATPDIIREHFPQVQLLQLAQKTEPGTARNLGIQQAQGAILCFLDADCVADPSWLSRLARAYDSDEYAAVGGAVLNGNPDSTLGWAGYLAEFREFFPFRPAHDARHIASCNISYKRVVFERYGLFPTDYYPQEDLVFNLRLYTDRQRILFDPAIQVAHLNKTSLTHFFRHQYRIGRITADVLKHYPFLKGSAFASSWFLALAAWLLLPPVKFTNTFLMALKDQHYRKHFFLVAPFLFLGLMTCWNSGFVRGAFLPRRHARKIIGERDRPFKWELVRWILQALTFIPGETGAWLRKWIIPFRTRGMNIRIMEHVWIERPDNLSLGENCRINRGVYIQATGGVDIGSNVGIGPGALIYSLNHNFRKKDRLYMDQGSTAARVVIEDDVWIASYVKIMPGVRIGQGCIVGSGAVVTKDTPPYSIVAGVPAKVIGYRE